MELKKEYMRTRFSESVIRKAAEKFDEIFISSENPKAWCTNLTIGKKCETWTCDNDEEFFSMYELGNDYSYDREIGRDRGYVASSEFKLLHFDSQGCTLASVSTKQEDLRLGKRGSIQAVLRVLDEHEQDCRLPEEVAKVESSPSIFIGHGRSQVWRDLRDHLTDRHGYRVETYETGARAGHAVRDVLQSMLEQNSFALLVLTGEDETKAGNMRARQNVIHETGLFQGRLGFSRAIVLIEDGVEEFSNISGIEQLLFTQIKEVFGDVLATLKREFDM